MKYPYIFLLSILILSGCSSTGNLSSFGNRKYTKGYFWDNPLKLEAKAKLGNETTQSEDKTKVEHEPQIALESNVKAIEQPIKAIIPIKKASLSKRVMNLAMGGGVKTENLISNNLLPDDPQSEVDEKTGKPINWGISAFICGVFCLLAGILALVALNDLAGISVLLFVVVALISGIISVLTAFHAIHVSDNHILFAKIALALCTISAILLLFLL